METWVVGLELAQTNRSLERMWVDRRDRSSRRRVEGEAARKGSVPDAGESLWQRDAGEGSAAPKSHVPNRGEAAGQRDGRKSGASVECIAAHNGDALRQRDGGEGLAVAERV